MENPRKILRTASPLPYIEKVGNIIEYYNFSSAIIVQINNCVARKLHPHSFCWNLSHAFPYANPYALRRSGPYPNLADIFLRPPLGSLKIIHPPTGVNGPLIACCFAQYRMGHSNSTFYLNCSKTDEDYRIKSLTKDTYPHRLDYFDQCLNKLCQKVQMMNNVDTIVFPKFIGSGMAGGDWCDYEEVITRFCYQIKCIRPDINVFIVEKENK